ncbi:MAG: AbrB/MazE/SpoVT family DNA-binding domain-containing protein [Kiritimatiellae bacterium]|nr:AbrB/MazE/SpoVT family DNA-binding domain-containing protein [Kiritimatiellia bacterium]
MKTHVCTLTERGQISIPADFRAELGLKPGDKLLWSTSGDKTLLITTVEVPKRKSFKSAIGYAKTFRKTMSTAEWMKILREGEEDDE